MARKILAITLTGLAVAGCAGTPHHPRLRAVADVEARSGSAVVGRVEFSEMDDHVRARVRLYGLEPNSEHGLHVHVNGDCSAPDASSAGGHFNPDDQPHGRATGGPHHAGDLPSIVADATGGVQTDLMLDGVTLAPGPRSIVGRSIVVHAKPDDYTTQPSGNAGPRIGCGVIVAAAAPSHRGQ